MLQSTLNKNNPYISESGFVKFADFVHPPWEFFKMDTDTEGLVIDNMFNGCIVYLHWNYYEEFINTILPQIKCKFKLITGVSDYIVPYVKEPARYMASDNLLNNSNLIKWYSINATIDHPKLIKIPIGLPRNLPFPTSFVDTDTGGDIVTYMGWNQEVKNASYVINRQVDILRGDNHIFDIMKSKADSKKLIYINHSTCNSSKGGSVEANVGFRNRLDDYIKEYTPFEKHGLMNWTDNLKIVQKHKYVLESFGRCYDGYRPWESILVGTIPIVFSSPINEIYNDLPILIIDSFDKLNEEYLEEQYKILINRDDYNFDKLYMKYWINLIKSS
jgi:hypothetical protein